MRSIREMVAVLFFLLLWTTASWPQSTAQSPAASGPAPQARPNHSSLLARSEMQKPIPLPITKPLRFQETPVATGREDLRQTNISIIPDKLQEPAPFTDVVLKQPSEQR
jgi:hypothetical protein